MSARTSTVALIAALTATDGSRTLAAAKLGVSLARVSQLVHQRRDDAGRLLAERFPVLSDLALSPEERDARRRARAERAVAAARRVAIRRGPSRPCLTDTCEGQAEAPFRFCKKCRAMAARVEARWA